MPIAPRLARHWLEFPFVSPKRRRRNGRGGFRPPHCPNPACRFHRKAHGWLYVLDGFYYRPSDGRRFRAFQCTSCRRKFSTRTFSTTYWLKHRGLLLPCAAWISEGPGLRQIARVMKTTHATVGRMVSRAGRHCLLFHTDVMTEAGPILKEELSMDGFETFEYSQYFPYHVNIAAGRPSCFIYHFNDAPLRRKGRMTPLQLLRRAELEALLGRPDPQAIRRAIYALIREVIRMVPEGMALYINSDELPFYALALDDVRRTKGCPTIYHDQTNSKVRRDTANPLFPVNLADLRIRHGQANHKRETIAFSKKRQKGMERQAIFVVWVNCIKKKSERKEAVTTSAMEIGLFSRPLGWRYVLRKRLFPGRIKLCPAWKRYYFGKVKTAIYGKNQKEHALKYAA